MSLPLRLRALGFRFPGYAEGIEVSGYHLHFVDAERRHGGHVLASRSSGLRAASTPPASCTSSCHRASTSPTRISPPVTHAAVERVERG